VAASDCVSKPMIGARSRQCAKRLASMTIGALAVTLMLVSTTCAQSAMGADQAAPLKVPGEGSRTPRMLPGEQGGPYPDPLEPFNQTMFNFNIDVDQWVVTPVAKGYSYVMPEPGRQSVNNFFKNIGVIPRFANNLFQLHVYNAGDELARFGINSTLGVAGLFDVADSWFGMKQHNDDFGLTLGHYGIYSGPYIMLPFLAPSTARDTVGLVVDGLMNPMSWLLPWYVTVPADVGGAAINAVNYRSLHPNQFEEADRYAVDLYGAVQDAYMQTRMAELKRLAQ
jgi:phospholipid-binding lipoprotein MlaA